jgi:RNA polymerase sigma-70 factor (ECF subfamily)
VVFRADPAAARLGGVGEIRGAESVARAFMGRATAAEAALIDGALGIVVAPNGRLLLVNDVAFKDGRIAAISAIAEPERLRRLDIAVDE